MSKLHLVSQGLVNNFINLANVVFSLSWCVRYRRDKIIVKNLKTKTNYPKVLRGMSKVYPFGSVDFTLKF